MKECLLTDAVPEGCLAKGSHCMRAFRFAMLAAFLCCIGFASASAATITFNSLSGTNGEPFTTYSEAGFNVASSNGQVFVGTTFGNPVPSLFGGPLFGTSTFAVTVTQLGGGTFAFEGYDVASNGGVTTLVVSGLLGGTTVFSTTQQQAATSGFVSLNNNAAALIDTLVLSFTPGGTSANVDNIRVTAPIVSVPEPMSLALFGVGLFGLGLVDRKKSV